ncbi:hypothetical protein ACFX2I_042939 [Malus domestica]
MSFQDLEAGSSPQQHHQSLRDPDSVDPNTQIGSALCLALGHGALRSLVPCLVGFLGSEYRIDGASVPWEEYSAKLRSLSLSLSLLILPFFFVFVVTDSTFFAFPRDPSFQWPHQRAPRLDVVCKSDSEGLRYQACEPVLEVGTCEPNHQLNTIVEGAGAAGERDNNHDHQRMSKWAMLDRLVTSHDLVNDQDSSSKGAAYKDANAPFSVN